MPPHHFRCPLISHPRTLALAFAVAASACGRSHTRSATTPPDASFLVVAGDSTFWIETGGAGTKVRRSPLLLTQVNGDFHELYVAEDDRSYFDALIVGQRLFRRDLVSGDSTVLLDDTTLASIAKAYGATHPNETPLGEDDEVSTDPGTHATTETELVDALGPFLTFEQRQDIEIAGARDDHATRRGVIDVRDGHIVSVRDLAGLEAARRVHNEGRRLLALAVDSIRKTNDDRAKRALEAIAGFVFDSLSFALVEDSGSPAIEFLVPGRGERAGGFALPLPPVRIPPGPWWEDVRVSLPTASHQQLQWQGSAYDVVAHADTSGEWATMALRQRGREWPVTRVPLPVRRVHRLDGVSVDSPRLRALSRAFDESSLYSGEARTASLPKTLKHRRSDVRLASLARRPRTRHS